MSNPTPDATIWGLLVDFLQPGDLPAARFTCRDLAAAVDGSSSAISRLAIPAWQPIHTPLSLQHSITALTATVNSTNDWSAMQQFLQHLPQLRSLCCTGRRTWPPQLPAGSPSAPPHPQLQALSFAGLLTSLQTLATLAPNTRSLSCQALVLRAHSMAGNTAAHSSSSSSSSSRRGGKGEPGPEGEGGSGSACGSGSLPSCRVFAAEAVTIAAEDEEEAGMAFAAALPGLQVLAHTPAFTWSVPAGFSMRRRILPLQHALRPCSGLTQLRTFGSSTASGGLLPAQLAGLQQLQRLSVFGVGPAVELLGISQLTRLTALSLAFQLPDKRCAGKLVAQVGSLPQLVQLALPAKLLCGKCCPGAREHLQDVILQSHSTPSSSTSGGAAAAAAPALDSSASSRSFQRLQQLLLLCRPKADHRLYQCGDYCKHNSLQQLQDLAHQLAGHVQGTALPLGVEETGAVLSSAFLPPAAAAAAAPATVQSGIAPPVAPNAQEAVPRPSGSLNQHPHRHFAGTLGQHGAAAGWQQQQGAQAGLGGLQVGCVVLGCDPERLPQATALVTQPLW